MKKRRPMNAQERLAVIAVLLLVWMLGIGARLVHLQVYQQEWLEAKALRQQDRSVDITAPRGRILDREGRELAQSVETRSIYANISKIADAGAVARTLSPLLDMPADDIVERLSLDRSFVLLKRKLDLDAAKQVEDLNIEGIEFVTEMKREYPKHQLASHVLGYCGVDGDGLAGIEHTLNSEMRGRDGRIVLSTDARGVEFDSVETAPIPGNDVQLTIDETAQYRVEQALAAGVKQTGANWGIAIVLRPQTGEILAMANYPTYDANLFGKASDDVRRNRAVQTVFEPGSVFKIVPYSGCLQEGLITPNTMVDCQYGSINVAGRTVHDTPYGVLKASDALAFSSNVAAIKMGQKLGNARFYDYIRQYGFGQKTGVELPGESAGIVQAVEKWGPTTIGSIPMGHEVSVTALQEVAAMAALANGGRWVQPHLVMRTVDRNDKTLTVVTPEERRVVSEETARQMTGMLEAVVFKGTAKHTDLKEFHAAGKTGTAQKIDPRSGAYSHTRYLASFCGFAPADDPQLACIVVLDEPTKGGHTGGVTAAPIFGNILETLFTDYAIPVRTGAESDRSMIAQGRTIERTELANITEVAAATTVAPASTSPDMQMLESQSPASGAVVPDLRGRGLRDAVRLAAEAGLSIEVTGSGIVEEQSLSPGSVVEPGTTLAVSLKR